MVLPYFGQVVPRKSLFQSKKPANSHEEIPTYFVSDRECLWHKSTVKMQKQTFLFYWQAGKAYNCLILVRNRCWDNSLLSPRSPKSPPFLIPEVEFSRHAHFG